ncbi:unnamed protein product [Meganyctiphanes norvegica]|uniref:Uncharacterized protein n=1 Tax=Meganyctiphanes norvegica TaxID=48144 RepID=A0AAV2Q3S0_MEGNR
MCISISLEQLLAFLWYYLSETKKLVVPSATDFQLIGALANILGARMFMSLMLVEALLPFTVLQMVIIQDSMLSLRALLFDLYTTISVEATISVEVSISCPSSLCLADA